MRYPPGTVTPAVIESPSGMTFTPPFDSAAALPAVATTPAIAPTASTAIATAPAHHLPRPRAALAGTACHVVTRPASDA